jgi:hypothetical protein
VVKYCRDWNLKCNFKKTKILVFKNGGKLKRSERWSMYNQIIDVTDETYLGVTLDSTRRWNRHMTKLKGNHT